MAKKDSTTGNTFAEEFAAQRRAGEKTFMWDGKSYSTDLAPSGGPGRKPTPPDARSKASSYAGQGRPTKAAAPKWSDGYKAASEDGEDTTERISGPGRKPTPPSNPGRNLDPGDKIDPNTLLPKKEYKSGGRVTGYRGYGKAKKV